MRTEGQRRYLLTLIENAPSLAFIGIIQLTGDLRVAGGSCAVLAACVLTFFAIRKVPSHPILLGLNLFMLAASPTIETAFVLGFDGVGEFLASHIHVGLTTTVLLAGLVLTVTSARGFIGASNLARRDNLRLSTILLAVAASGVLWSAVFEGQRFLAIGVPLIALFGTRQFLLAGLTDEKDRTPALGPVVASSAFAPPRESETL